MKKACFIVLAIVIACSFIQGGAITAQDTEAYKMPTIQKLNHSLKELQHELEDLKQITRNDKN